MLTGIMQGASEWRITIVDFPDLLEDRGLCFSNCGFVSTLSLVNGCIRAGESFTFVLNLLCNV